MNLVKKGNSLFWIGEIIQIKHYKIQINYEIKKISFSKRFLLAWKTTEIETSILLVFYVKVY